MSKIKVPKGWVFGASPDDIEATTFKTLSRGRVDLSVKMGLSKTGRRRGAVGVCVEGAANAVHTVRDLDRLIDALQETYDIARQMQEYKR